MSKKLKHKKPLHKNRKNKYTTIKRINKNIEILKKIKQKNLVN